MTRDEIEAFMHDFDGALCTGVLAGFGLTDEDRPGYALRRALGLGPAEVQTGTDFPVDPREFSNRIADVVRGGLSSPPDVDLCVYTDGPAIADYSHGGYALVDIAASGVVKGVLGLDLGSEYAVGELLDGLDLDIPEALDGQPDFRPLVERVGTLVLRGLRARGEFVELRVIA